MDDGLNPAQREAVRTHSGPLLVLAGAGSGKTRVVTHRIAEIIRRGTPAERILAVTFTNKAAREMVERALSLLGQRAKSRPEISTFHSLCVRILRRQIERLGFPRNFAIHDSSDQESTIRAALREIRVPNESLRPRDALGFIGRWKSAAIRPEQAAAMAETDKEHLAAMAYRRYQRSLQAAGALDFDDLLLRTEELFQHHAEARHAEAARFDHLLIDEYQDTNASQYRIIAALAGAHRNLCVVGDDDQSIYGWRGAEVTHILRFRHDWPDAKVVRLEENYRSTEAILSMANRLIAFNKLRHDKILRAARRGGEQPRILQFQDENLEAAGVAEEIRRRLESGAAAPRDFAILFRTNEQPRAFETALRKHKLSYVLIGGMSFFDRKEVRDILAYLRVVAQPRDETSLLRIVNRPARGIGEGSIAKLTDVAVKQGKTVWEFLPHADRVPGIPDTAVRAMRSLHANIQEWRGLLEHKPILEVTREILRRIGYKAEIDRQYADPQERERRWQAVEEVVNALADYQRKARDPSLTEFIDQMTLGDREDDRDKESQLSRNAIALMTLHSAKGLEFPEVYMVGMEEGLLPHHRAVAEDGAAIDEERRLCYVGITRARDRLTLSLSLTRMKWGKPRETHPSRFLYEITGQADHPNAQGQRRGKRQPSGRPHAARPRPSENRRAKGP